MTSALADDALAAKLEAMAEAYESAVHLLDAADCVSDYSADAATLREALATIRAREEALAVAREGLERLRSAGPDCGTWTDAVTPLIGRFELAAKFDANAVHNGDGSAALAELLRNMAAALDRCVDTTGATLARIDAILTKGEG